MCPTCSQRRAVGHTCHGEEYIRRRQPDASLSPYDCAVSSSLHVGGYHCPGLTEEVPAQERRQDLRRPRPRPSSAELGQAWGLVLRGSPLLRAASVLGTSQAARRPISNTSEPPGTLLEAPALLLRGLLAEVPCASCHGLRTTVTQGSRREAEPWFPGKGSLDARCEHCKTGI